MNVIMLGIGDYGSSTGPNEIVKTMALGSCVALIIIDPKTRMVGMVHIALPDSSINKQKAKELPGYFADTGIPALIAQMQKKGMNLLSNRVIIKLVGGAKIMDNHNTFNIGKRNVMAIKKILWKYGLGPRSEDVGGNISRTVQVDSNRGKVLITVPGREPWNI